LFSTTTVNSLPGDDFFSLSSLIEIGKFVSYLLMAWTMVSSDRSLCSSFFHISIQKYKTVDG